MIKSSKLSVKFANASKREQLDVFIAEYRRVVSVFVDLLWMDEKIPCLLPSDTTSKIDSWLSARAVQCAGKQASGIVRGTRKKQEKRLFMINKLLGSNLIKKAKKLQGIYDRVVTSKPSIATVNPELDGRFIKINTKNNTSFDIWLTISSLGNKLKLVLPLKRSKHFNELDSKGAIKAGVRLGPSAVTFMFDLPDVPKKEQGAVLGIDIGLKSVLSCSDGVASYRDTHGHDLDSILQVMTRKKKGSLGFKRSKSHRKNYINWSINQLNLRNYKEVRLENIKHLRRGRRSSSLLSHWTYTEIFDKLKSKCEEQGVLVTQISATYTSQRCSACGWVRKSNRKGKLFRCGSCSFEHDADLNAAKNIALPLIGIPKQQRLLQANRAGFYWLVEGQEPIVPVTHKMNTLHKFS